MSICTFCHETLFSSLKWIPEKALTHHTSLQEWERSLQSPCTICVVLLEQVRMAMKEAKATSALRAKPAYSRPDPKRDEYIRAHTVEEELLDWLKREAGSDVEAMLPVYQAVLRDGGASDAWVLAFEPVDVRKSCEQVLRLPKQSFSVYAAAYDGLKSRPGAQLENSTRSETTLAQIRQWVNACRDHPDCHYLHREPKEDETVPTRLLDLGEPGSGTQALRLVETGNANVKTYRPYVTLSYKWGYNPSCRLFDHNREAYLHEIPWDILPTTFRDAVSVTRRLGIRYLWIDALCIIQEDNEEWLREAPRMEEIYCNSFLSLAAVSADNCDQGLYRTREGMAAPPSVTHVSLAYQNLDCCVVRDDFWKGEILSEPLYTRGWVVQERLLAPRILHFQRRQVLWQCPSLTASERLPEGLSTVVDDERREELRWRKLFHRPEQVFSSEEEVLLQNVWRYFVQSYTSCDLTKSRDKLMAISGIAKRMKVAFHGEGYVAGMWKRELVEQLAWRVVRFRPPTAETAYRAPSWAWASVDGVVKVPARLRYKRAYTMDIKEGDVKLELERAEEEVGTLISGSLKVRAQLYRLTFVAPSMKSPEWAWRTADGTSQHAWCRFFPDEPMHNAENDAATSSLLPPGDDGSVQAEVDCLTAMLVYEEDFEDDGAPGAISGYALALRESQTGASKVFSRIGLIQFRALEADSTWKAFQAARDAATDQEGLEHTRDGRDEFDHVITII